MPPKEYSAAVKKIEALQAELDKLRHCGCLGCELAWHAQ
jgi:hypothetical protein